MKDHSMVEYAKRYANVSIAGLCQYLYRWACAQKAPGRNRRQYETKCKTSVIERRIENLILQSMSALPPQNNSLAIFVVLG